MNPFSGFLQPVPQRPIDTSGVNDVVRTLQQQKEFKLRQLENAQRNALEQRGANRADAELALQQGEQTHRFGLQEQKQVEDALSEYHDAVDTGDPIRIARATDMLKRFGMTVGAGQPARPDLKAVTGQSLLPNVQAKAMPSPEKPEQDLSQTDFENQLIAGDKTPERYEQGGNTTEEFRKMLPQAPEPSEEQAEGEPPGGVIDLDKDNPEPLQIGKPQDKPAGSTQVSSPAPKLPGQLLPTVISKGGKMLEESQGQAGRYSPMVSAVFEPLIDHDNPEMAAAGQRAQAISSKLITVDGVAPKDAIRIGMDYLEKEANRINSLERTKIGSKAHVAGIPGATPTFNPKARQFFTNEMHESVQKFKNENIETGIRGYDSALTALNSSNPASQNDAINQLIAARSGKTVSDRERAIYENISGLWNGIQKKYNMAAGNPMPEEVKGQIRALLADAKQAVVQAREERAKAAEAYHRAKLRGANPTDVEADSKAVGEAIRMGSGDSGGGDNADLWQ